MPFLKGRKTSKLWAPVPFFHYICMVWLVTAACIAGILDFHHNWAAMELDLGQKKQTKLLKCQTKKGIWENIKHFKNKLQSSNLSNSVKYWSFTLLIMHYFVYGSLCFSLWSDFCAGSQLYCLSAALSRLHSLTFCLQFWHKPLRWAGFFRWLSPLVK